MYSKVLNSILVLFIISFFFFILKYYLSNKAINEKNYNRQNIEEILKEKIFDLPVLLNDTDNIIEFNNSIEDSINKKKRSFWDLLKNK